MKTLMLTLLITFLSLASVMMPVAIAAMLGDLVKRFQKK